MPRWMIGFGIIAVAGAGVLMATRLQGDEVTYHDQVSRIVQNNCQVCHRDGGVGPFPFQTYDDVFARRGMIEYVVQNRIMPPWFADPEVGHFANDRSLSTADRKTLLRWIADGAPAGDPNIGPEQKTWKPGWFLGEPDATVQIKDPFVVPTEGVVDYQHTYVQTAFSEDKWITAMEIRPTDLSTVHHVLVFIEPPDAKSPRDAAPGEPVVQGGIEGYFAAWVPGFQGNIYPEGSAKLLPAGSWLKFQIHYTPNGVETVDQTMLGFHFADAPPDRKVETSSAYNAEFEIPANDPDHTVDAVYTFKESGSLLSLFPHLHLRGKRFRYDLVYPDGREVSILNVPRYDFNWQLTYHFAEPIEVPAGTRLVATGTWDNSKNNPFNPDPDVAVRFGEQTFDEMMIGYFDWIASDQSIASAGASR